MTKAKDEDGTFDRKQADRSVENLLAEYFEIRDLNDAKQYIEELSAPTEIYHPILVHSIVSAGTRKLTLIELAASLLVKIQKDDILSSANLLSGLLSFCDTIEEESSEFPNLPKFTGQLVGFIIRDGVLELKDLLFLQKVKFSNPKCLVPIKFYGSALDTVFKQVESEEEVELRLSQAGLSLSLLSCGLSITADMLPRFIEVRFSFLFLSFSPKGHRMRQCKRHCENNHLFIGGAEDLHP